MYKHLKRKSKCFLMRKNRYLNRYAFFKIKRHAKIPEDVYYTNTDCERNICAYFDRKAQK